MTFLETLWFFNACFPDLKSFFPSPSKLSKPTTIWHTFVNKNETFFFFSLSDSFRIKINFKNPVIEYSYFHGNRYLHKFNKNLFSL